MAVKCHSRMLGRSWLFVVPDVKKEPIGDGSLFKLTQQVTSELVSVVSLIK